METSAISPASLTSPSTINMSPQPLLKMEDFSLPTPTPGPQLQLSATKPVKKRKSWGQELPEPKTNLPPRKRAKTDDEKEQRRIERIKRNRAAAHNSRERKRLEAEQLQIANEGLQKQMQALQQQLALYKAQLAKCETLIPGGLPQLTAADFTNFTFDPSEDSRFVT
ncbi:transcription factor that binds to CRE motif [Taxawa tesnikishii (nom. ined.)]|nr:transcription factor that binds to CRE motif [Dothideales sp. JES 119]